MASKDAREKFNLYADEEDDDGNGYDENENDGDDRDLDEEEERSETPIASIVKAEEDLPYDEMQQHIVSPKQMRNMGGFSKKTKPSSSSSAPAAKRKLLFAGGKTLHGKTTSSTSETNGHFDDDDEDDGDETGDDDDDDNNSDISVNENQRKRARNNDETSAAAAATKKVTKKQNYASKSSSIIPKPFAASYRPLFRDGLLNKRDDTAGTKEHKILTLSQRRKIIADYYDTTGNHDKLQTYHHFVGQRGWPRSSVRRHIEWHQNGGSLDNSGRKERPRKFDWDDIWQRYNDALNAADGDHSQVDIRSIANDICMTYKQVYKILVKDPAIRGRLHGHTAENEPVYEARRSLVTAYFVNATGDYKERRNACVRHFTKILPNLRQTMIFEMVDRFVRTGSVRSVARNIRYDWGTRSGNRHKYTARAMELDGAEAEFMKQLQCLQTEAEVNRVRRESTHGVWRETSSTPLYAGSTTNKSSKTTTSDKRIIQQLTEQVKALEHANIMMQQELSSMAGGKSNNGAVIM